MAIPFGPSESGESPLIHTTTSVEVVFTLNAIITQVSNVIDNFYGESTEPTRILLSKGNDIFEILKIALDGSVGKKEFETTKAHQGPYSLDEIKIAIQEISGQYHCHFLPEKYSDVETLILNWVKSFPDPEVAAEDDFMNLLCGM